MKITQLSVALMSFLGTTVSHAIDDSRTFDCPYPDQIKVQGKTWSSDSVPGNWKGSGGDDVDEFQYVAYRNRPTESTITCTYKTNNDSTANKTANQTGFVSITVPYPYNNCYVSPSASNPNRIKCEKLIFCPDARSLKENGPPPEWTWSGSPPRKSEDWQMKSAAISADTPLSIVCMYSSIKETGVVSLLLHSIPDNKTCSTNPDPCWKSKPENCPISCKENYRK